MRVFAIALIALLFAFAGCGGGDEGEERGTAGGGATTEEQATSTPETGGEEAGGTEPEGKQLFAGTCGSCHTLADAGTTGTFGPNLDDLGPDKERVLTAIKSGPGQMPENLLEGADAEAVADYVSSAAGSS